MDILVIALAAFAGSRLLKDLTSRVVPRPLSGLLAPLSRGAAI